MKNNEYDDYKVILEKLNNGNLDCINFMGVVSYAIYSKEVFPKNKGIVEFLDTVFGLKYLDYVIKSRSLITARVTRHILSLEDDELRKSVQNIVNYITSMYPEVETKKESSRNNNKSAKKKNANEKLGTWLKGL
ncbi:hypothetical protein [Clostridium sp. UBA1353]|uniref:hypothetical protein n=1 Tax=Clostridium sp. UBA1353 TaxID=1946347 RepID=UPI0032171240